ncbi:MAG TPA: hypothetical protein VID27_09120 [Blastocatellia bacterium]|jgi:hypothetical protein
MKYCPHCREGFEDDLKYCTFDGTALKVIPPDAKVTTQPPDHRQSYSQRSGNGAWRFAFLGLFLIAIICAAALAIVYFRREQHRDPAAQPARAASPPSHSAEPPAVAEETKPSLELAQLPRAQLMEMLPPNLLRRFHATGAAQGKPDDLRIVKDDKSQYIVLVGTVRVEGGTQRLAERVMILQYDTEQFTDVTRRALPASVSSGVILGQRSQAKFEAESSNLMITVPASSSAIVKECTSCEHAYQVVTLEWKGSRYVETARQWDNDRYTAFYVVAEALERRRVDGRVRGLIAPALDPVITEGFDRAGREGWTVQARVESEAAETGAYELINGERSIVITVSKINGQWKAVRISDR